MSETAPPELLAELEQVKTQHSMLVNTARTLPWNSRHELGAFLSSGTSGDRDYFKSFHYPEVLSLNIENHYLPMYLRNGIAARVCQMEPVESWKKMPSIQEDPDPEVETDFEIAVRDVFKNVSDPNQEGVSPDQEIDYLNNKEMHNKLMGCLKNADILAGIGRFGGIFLGFNDGADPREPLIPNDNMQLMFMTCLDESNITPKDVINDKSNPRHGLPEHYNTTLTDWKMEDAISLKGAGDTSEQPVHWTRIIHVIPHEHSSKVFGIPRQQPVYNDLLDIFRISGSDAEMWWQGAYGGLSVETIPQLGSDARLDIESVKKQIQLYNNDIQRFIALSGAQAKRLETNISDPMPHMETHIDNICINKGWPKRIFMGSERGELASTQDSTSWNSRMDERCEFHITPNIIAPTINRLIWAGVLPKPENEDGYSVKWPGLVQTDEGQQADIAVKRTQAIVQYIAGAGDQMISEVDYLTHIIGLDQNVAQEMVETAEQDMEDKIEERLEKQERGVSVDGRPLPPALGLDNEEGAEGGDSKKKEEESKEDV